MSSLTEAALETNVGASSTSRGRGIGYIAGAVLLLAGLASTAPAAAPANPPNILLFILDDVGIDQMSAFGYGGATPPRTPNIEAIANAGVRFRNFWTMPECSPSRALLFEGRYPLRTNVYDAILSVDLANSQVSPYETTTPKVLRQAGYASGLFGKFHLTGSDVNQTATNNNPLGFTAVHQLGWDDFAGWQDGAPHPIDTTAGGIAPQNTHACGFVPNTTESPANGADAGACYFVNGSCSPVSRTPLSPTPGRTCLERGGIFNPGAACASPVPATVDFTLENGYYVGELVVNRPDGTYTVSPPEDPSGAGRGYRTILESDRAIGWINAKAAAAPWMATVSFSSAHTPYQQAPTSLLPAASLPTGSFDCLVLADQRVLSNQMIEAMDAEIGRVLVQTGVATRNGDGTLAYDPRSTDTMIVILGDNGTYAPVVKFPFNPERAKATVYQTGVWTPLIVAGPLVEAPGRTVSAMVNVADVFQLFGEMAGIDVHAVGPKSRPLDSVAMLPYLTNPDQRSLRRTNFTQTQPNLKPAGYVVPPCVVAGVDTCVQLFPSQSLCGSEGGVWWGTGDDGTAPVGAGAPQPDCCSVNRFRVTSGAATYSVLPDWQMAMRDDQYKLVRSATTDFDASTSACATTESREFYAINEKPLPMLRLDDATGNLLGRHRRLDSNERRALFWLTRELNQLLASEVACPGDGNRDGVVDQTDLDQFKYWANTTNSMSSWYDFNLDGLTNQNDVPFITNGRFPRTCPTADAAFPQRG
ncbi:MAG: sulfatase-like hydrolase/transferase [Betaproteobacteria bacterium]